MSDDEQDTPHADGSGAGAGEGASGQGGAEEVGSVGEEAAKLLGALSAWAREQGQDYQHAASGAASGFAAAVGDVNAHLATGSEDCRYCPLCQAISLVRQTSPEVRQHLSAAASSLLQAASGALGTQVPRDGSGSAGSSGPARGSGIEHIDLDGGWEDSGDDEPQGPAGKHPGAAGSEQRGSERRGSEQGGSDRRGSHPGGPERGGPEDEGGGR